MTAIAIAIGNPLRRDDGAAHEVSIPAGFERRALLQLTPEIAQEIAPFDLVVFIDADITATVVKVDPVKADASSPPLSHVSRPSEIVALARALFGFTGEAYTCHIPIHNISACRGLTARTRKFAEQAAREIYKIGQSHENSRLPTAGRLARFGSAR